jgi:hypothetical protein
MKAVIALFLGVSLMAILLMSIAPLVHAHDIQGTLVLKGSLKTKLMVNSVETICKVKVDNVRNLLIEDSFGNPAYVVDVELSLDGEDKKRKLKIKHQQKLPLTNIFQVNAGTQVNDLVYASSSGEVILEVKEDGRMNQIRFPYERKTLTCNF